jgi:hypothetical protein
MGSAFTTFGNDPIPATSDGVLIPADFSAFAEAVEHKIMQWVADQAERDVLYAAAAAPVLVGSPTALWLKISGSGGGSVWKTLWQDSGSVTTGFTNGTDFTVSGGYVRKMNNALVQLTVTTLRANTTLGISGAGNIVGDPIMFTLPTGYWPTITTPGIVRLNTGEALCEIDTSGVCRILAGVPSYTIAIAETCVVAATYFTP